MLTLFKGYKYDNSYDYVKGFSSLTVQNNYFNSLPKLQFDDVDYIKEHNSIVIDLNYDYLVMEGINYLCVNNGYKNVYMFIVNKEYLSDETTRLYTQMDDFQTYMFDYTIKESFVERKKCEINEISDFDEGLDIGEHKIVSDTIVIDKGFTYFALFSGIRNFELVLDENGKIVDYLDLPTTYDRPMTMIDGIHYPLFFIPITTMSQLNVLSDHPSLVAIVRFPECTVTTNDIEIPKIIKSKSAEVTEPDTYMVATIHTKIATSISTADKIGTAVDVPKTDVTDFFPYTYYVLTDGETEPLIMYPQDLPGSITVKGKFALSNAPVERYYVEGYKGDTTGKVYNITNTSVMTLPTATNKGMEYLTANAGMMQLQRNNIISSATLTNTISGVGIAAGLVGAALAPVTGGLSLAAGAAIVGGASSMASNTASAINKVKEADRRAKDMMLTPNSISSLGTPSTRNKFGTNNVRIIKYSVSDTVKAKIRNFTNRFGNKFNGYATINHKTYKGYLKMVAPDIDSTIDINAVVRIKSILERGVYIE